MSERRALIVENEIEDVNKIQSLLHSRGIESDFVDSALAARLKIKEKQYDLLILDLDLGSGTDDGKFLLDTIFNEKLILPTIIISNSGFLPHVIALKGKFEFVVESFDKKHLAEMLPLLDKIISNPKMGKVVKLKNDNTKTGLFKLLGVMLIFLFMFLVIIGAIVITVNMVSPWLFGLVMIATLLIFLAVAVVVLRTQQDLSEFGFLEIVGRIIQSLPLLSKSKVDGSEKK
jgi:CheY-like chemotaxis protein